MSETSETRVWSADVVFSETADRTEATATVRTGDAECTGHGVARRNPNDPSVPRMGEELAAARAFADLSHKLLEESAKILEGHIGREVSLTA